MSRADDAVSRPMPRMIAANEGLESEATEQSPATALGSKVNDAPRSGAPPAAIGIAPPDRPQGARQRQADRRVTKPEISA